jgi:hypothetical protein
MTTLWLFFACTGGTDGTANDSGVLDTGLADTGTPDTGTPDTGPTDGFGLGELTGDCGVLGDEEWLSDRPFLFRNRVDMVGWSEDLLSEEGLLVLEAGNLGGSSLESEVLAFEVLHWCEWAQLEKTEAEITYEDSGGKKTDVLVVIDERRVGVSVTRAYHWPEGEPYTQDEASSLLERKLLDLVASAENAAEVDAWERSVLHILAYDSQHADLIEGAWTSLESDVRADHIVVMTVTDGEDQVIY